ncbi:hypothetical protein AL475_15985 [Vibrio fluvialis]|nr:hypothetical protein AL475_15985 [Vibrio fluvialis]EKO3474086.1 hypothetical protein [Vibrio fluvialis]
MASKTELLSNIMSLIQLIDNSEHEIVESTGPLHALYATLDRSNFPQGLEYVLDDLKFKNVSNEQFITSYWDPESLNVQLHLSIKMQPNTEFKYNNVAKAVVEITYDAITKDMEHFSHGAWHLDFHHHKGAATDFIHPNFHLHNGGQKVKDAVIDYGELVLLDAPRLLHPPLDLFLAFDMVLTNFFKRRIWANFRANTSYQEIIKASQEKWWKDYYSQIADYWKYQTSGVDCTEKRTLAQTANPFLFI